VLGYVGEINARQLGLPRYKEHGYKAGDVIGKEGLEATYDQYLRGRDGSRRVIVDSLGRIGDVIEINEPTSGQDLVTADEGSYFCPPVYQRLILSQKNQA